MKRGQYFLPVLIIVCSFYLYQKYFKTTGKLPVSFATSNNPCAQKKMCAVIYVAPWCPACKQMAPMFQAFLKNAQAFNRDEGVMIVVGGGREPGENEREAEDLGVGAIIDGDQSVARSLAVRRFPSFFVVDQTHKVVMSDQNALEWAAEHFAD